MLELKPQMAALERDAATLRFDTALGCFQDSNHSKTGLAIR